MKYLAIFLLAIFLLSCYNQSNKKEDIKTTNSTAISCYISAFNKDTIMLQLKDSISILIGILNYLPYEKDSRIGYLYDMKFKKDTLFGMYKSTQEGKETFCEIAMLKRDDNYILTNDIWNTDNYQYDTSYTYGKFIDKTKITFTGDTLKIFDSKE